MSCDVQYIKRRKGWIMSCDVGEVTERLGNELCFTYVTWQAALDLKGKFVTLTCLN